MKGDLSISVTNSKGGLPMETEPITVAVTTKNTGKTAHTFYIQVWVSDGITGSYCNLYPTGNFAKQDERALELAPGEEVMMSWNDIVIEGLISPGTRYVIAKVFKYPGESNCLNGAYQPFTVTAPTVSASITSIIVS